MEKKQTDFDRFWEAYPKRKGDNPRHPARTKFDLAIRDGADPQDIIDGAVRYAEVQKYKIGTEFIPMARTWLYQKRWEDYQYKPSIRTTSSDNETFPSTSCVGDQFFVQVDSPQWHSWQEFMVRTTGKRSPVRNFGWWFPSPWPPEITHPEASNGHGSPL